MGLLTLWPCPILLHVVRRHIPSISRKEFMDVPLFFKSNKTCPSGSTPFPSHPDSTWKSLRAGRSRHVGTCPLGGLRLLRGKGHPTASRQRACPRGRGRERASNLSTSWDDLSRGHVAGLRLGTPGWNGLETHAEQGERPSVQDKRSFLATNLSRNVTTHVFTPKRLSLCTSLGWSSLFTEFKCWRALPGRGRWSTRAEPRRPVETHVQPTPLCMLAGDSGPGRSRAAGQQRRPVETSRGKPGTCYISEPREAGRLFTQTPLQTLGCVVPAALMGDGSRGSAAAWAPPLAGIRA